ncbi:MAG: DUF2079 domain-containing protein [Candidatus Jordarchaeum sp.]|uniref:DUF2079 domain-containing protein n=1 Tax=Candidatus Jordarchaeum sp. TaxID=2823881 RepID=UPI00404B5A5C
MNKTLGRNLTFKSRVLEFVETKPQYVLYLSIAIYTVVFSYFTVIKHFAFETYAGDLGIYEQSLWSTLRYGLFFYNTPELGVHFGYHFAPIFFLLLPVYSVYPSPLTLLVLQSFFLALGAIPVFWLARDELESSRGGLVFVFLYLLYPPLQGVNWYDFHPECLAPFLLIAAFYYFRKEKFVRYFVLITLAMMCKELIPFIIVFMGIYGFWINRKKIVNLLVFNPKGFLKDKGILSSLLTIFAGCVWYVLSGIIMNMYRITPYNPYKSWFYLGGSLVDILTTAITSPLYVLQLAFTPFYSKVIYLIVLFGPLAFLSFLNPPSLLISLPWLGPSLVSLLPNHFQPVGTQYPALLVPFIFISAVYGSKFITPVVRSLALKTFSNNPIMNRIMKNKFVRRKALYAANNPLEMTLILLLVFSIIFCIGWSPLGTFPKVTFHDQALKMIVYTIPPYSSVATQNEIFPHIAHNLNAYPVYHPYIEYDYILADKTSIFYYLPPIFGQYSSPVPPLAFSSVVPELISNGTYGILISVDGIMLLKRGYTGPALINL